jgi:hypothetical protein
MLSICKPVPIRKEFSFAKQPEKKLDVSTEDSRENIQISGANPEASENISEEQKS